MKEMLLLSLLSLASAMCASNYVIWVSQDRTPFHEAIGRALPGLKLEEVEALNHRFSPTNTEPGRIYKIPYDESVIVVPPASLSGGCPKTLTLESSRQEAENSPPLRPKSKRMIARSHLGGSNNMNLEGRSVGTSDGSEATQTPTAIASTSVSIPAATATANIMSCWTAYHPKSKFDASLESRTGFASLFCDKLNHIRLNAQHPLEEEPYEDAFLSMQVLRSCPNHSIGKEAVVSCREVMKNINHQCPEAGGWFRTDCLLYFFVPREAE